MGRKKETVEASATEAPAKKSRNNLIPAIVVAAGLLGAGYFMSQGGGKANAAAAASTPGPTPTTTAKEANGDVDKINSVTINLADGHYVKLGLALQLKEGIKAADFDAQSAKALDLAIATMGDRTMAQLAAPGGRDAAKDDLSRKVLATYNGKVTAIFFTEFVMQ